MNYARLNILKFLEVITELQGSIFHASLIEEDPRQEDFDYYKRCITSFLISRDSIGHRFVDTLPEMLYNIQDLNRLYKETFNREGDFYDEISADELA